MEVMEEHVEEADDGELHVLRRALSGHKGANHEEHDGQVCSLIVDGGSCTNMASLPW